MSKTILIIRLRANGYDVNCTIDYPSNKASVQEAIQVAILECSRAHGQVQVVSVKQLTQNSG